MLDNISQNASLKIIEPDFKKLELKNFTLSDEKQSSWAFGFVAKDYKDGMYSHEYFKKGIIFILIIFVILATIFFVVYCLKTRAYQNLLCYKLFICLRKTEFH